MIPTTLKIIRIPPSNTLWWRGKQVIGCLTTIMLFIEPLRTSWSEDDLTDYTEEYKLPVTFPTLKEYNYIEKLNGFRFNSETN